MVNIQVYEKDSNKKIASYRCGENETMVNLEKLEKKYGATQHSHIEKDTSKKTTMIRYYRESETHTIIISMSEWQAERVNEYLADYWEFVRLFDDEEMTEELEDNETETVEKIETETMTETGDENMTENNGYDRDFVLLQAGEFECGGRTFKYEGEPITVGDVLDRTIGMDFPIASDRDYKGHLGITETGHIYCMVTTYMRDVRHLLSWEQIVYAPLFEEMYETASDFVESRIELLQRFQPTKKFQEKVDHCTYKGRFFKELVKMSADELEAIDNSSAEFSPSDVQAYLDFLLAEAQDPSTWVKDLVITEDHIDYHIRNRINWGIDYCEKYCSPSLSFFKLADKMYQESKVDRSAQDDESEDDVIEFECTRGSASFKGYAYSSELDDDEPLHFYDRNYGSQTSLTNAHFEGSEDDVFALKDAFCSDFLFTQFLSDYADKSATIRREGYVLHINGGEQVSLTFEKVGNFSTDSCDASYDVRIIPSTRIRIDADLLDDLVSRVEQTWNSDANARVEDGLIICEFDKHFFDDDADFSDEIDEMTADYDAIICKQVIRNLGAYAEYRSSLENHLIRTNDRRCFDGDLLRTGASLFEEQLEEYKLRYLLSLSDDDLKRLVAEDIEETFCRD